MKPRRPRIDSTLESVKPRKFTLCTVHTSQQLSGWKASLEEACAHSAPGTNDADRTNDPLPRSRQSSASSKPATRPFTLLSPTTLSSLQSQTSKGHRTGNLPSMNYPPTTHLLDPIAAGRWKRGNPNGRGPSAHSHPVATVFTYPPPPHWQLLMVSPGLWSSGRAWVQAIGWGGMGMV